MTRTDNNVGKNLILDPLVRPIAVEDAGIYIFRTNRCSVVESQLVSSTEMIDKADPADEAGAMVDTEERRINYHRLRDERIGGIVVIKWSYDDLRRPVTPVTMMTMSPMSLV
ncbi:MAG: hypothetical protein GEU77_15240 [Deltaproteobacteria bacterium]|nr:hypothetical protein [Deltaproteobacteria bacterium]